MTRWMLHVDVDAFFASVEQALNPALRGRPVIVGGDGEQRTVVASCSYEARRRGVRTAMRTVEARARCPEAVFLRGDHRVYRRAAEAVLARLRELSPKVELLSLDEACLELEAQQAGACLEAAGRLCTRVWEELGLPLSAGLGSSRLVACLATRLAKPRGCFLLRRGYERTFLEGLPVEELPGVGRRTTELLHRFNIHRVGELARVPRELLVRTFGRRGELLHDFARGHDPRPVLPVTAPRSVSRETSFERPAAHFGTVFGMAVYLLDRAMKTVLSHGLRCRTLAVRLRYADGVAVERARSLKAPTAHEANLVPLVRELLQALFVRRTGVHLVGVTLSRLVPAGPLQHSLFDDDEERQERLREAVEQVRRRHGFGAILQGPAAELLGLLPRDRDGFRLRIPSLTR